jgi:two-component system, LytTR family, sensor kinase
MKISLPQYSGKDHLVLAVFVLPFTIVLNTVIFGTRMYSSWSFFLLATLLTGIAFSLDFALCGGIAVGLKKRFPKEEQTNKRLSFMIILFLIITGLFLLLLFRGYEAINFFGYKFNETGFVWACFGLGIANIFLTFLHEGIARYENWKANMKETEALKKVYRQSRLMSLKNQVSPHFLFNSLNSLSCLIQEDEKKGEKFLDEMSKVYRYMLHNDEEQLVTLETELKFLDSYLYLLQARYTDGFKVTLNINEREKNKWLPPLALQSIIENIISQNTICKDCPLEISITAGNENLVMIRNNVLPKTYTDEPDDTSGLDNLVKKYELLNQPEVVIKNSLSERVILLPLIINKTEVLS